MDACMHVFVGGQIPRLFLVRTYGLYPSSLVFTIYPSVLVHNLYRQSMATFSRHQLFLL